MSKIEWTDKTWNPATGCTPVSPGCANCYAAMMARRLQAMGQAKYRDGFKVTLHPDELEKPLHWKKPQKIFVCSMGDLFHEDVSDEVLFKIFTTMANAQWCHGHRFLVLTKRPLRMKDFIEKVRLSLEEQRKPTANPDGSQSIQMTFQFPLNNIWLGVTVCNQEEADEKIPVLLDIPATLRFVSIEPMLGEIDLTHVERMPDPSPRPSESITLNTLIPGCGWSDEEDTRLNWVIVGGETGANARPMNPDWARAIRDQCRAAGTPFFFKKMSGRQPIPADINIREFPKK
jgi:protein gp37